MNREQFIEVITDTFYDVYGKTLSKHGKGYIDSLIDTFGLDEVNTAIDIAVNQYDDAVTAMQKLKGILYNRERIRTLFFEE